MNRMGKVAAALFALIGTLVLAGSASATTFCMPDTSIPNCPTGGIDAPGTGVEALEAALSIDGSDGAPDEVHVGPGTISDSNPIQVSGSDPLTLSGNGRGKTVLTSTATSNTWVLDLYSNNSREVSVKDLTVLIPANFPNGGGNGVGILQSGDRFESVDVVARNDGSGAFQTQSPSGNMSFVDVGIYGENGASIGAAFTKTGSCGSGQITIVDLEVIGASSGFASDCPDVPATLDRVQFKYVNSAIAISAGAQVSVSNGLIESREGPPIAVSNAENKVTSLSLTHLTVVATGDPNQPAIRGSVNQLASPSKNVEISLTNSIVTGFQNSWSLEAPNDPIKGNVVFSVSHSNLGSPGTKSGEAFVDESTGNINQPPLFSATGDFQLLAGSPGIDAGDPNATAPTLDLNGTTRPIDGDRDGTAIRDMGAYEFDPGPEVCPMVPGPCGPPIDNPDRTPPKISKVKFRFKAGKGGAIRFRVSEAATTRIVLRPVPKKGRKVIKLTRTTAKAKALKVKLGKRRLKPGRYTLRIVAKDPAGNTSEPVVRKVRVKIGVLPRSD